MPMDSRPHPLQVAEIPAHVPADLVRDYDHVSGPEVLRHPPSAIDGLREGTRTFYSPRHGGFWVLTRYEHIPAAFQEPGARTRVEWLELAVAHHLPLGPANDGMGEVEADPQIRARRILHEGRDADGAPFTYIGQPALDGTPAANLEPAPGHSQHTRAILSEAGLSDAEIDAHADAAVTTAPHLVQDYIITGSQGE
ncbi:CoA transferase [Nocardia sp. NPDC052278]|uniref:CoA transferase n=1 Tax=unclassified Nocardia TaxID=2637762 RepID=UPI0036862CEA